MAYREIWLKNKKYYLFDVYDNRSNAGRFAQYYRKKHKSRYFILPIEGGWFYPRKRYALYFDNITSSPYM